MTLGVSAGLGGFRGQPTMSDLQVDVNQGRAFGNTHHPHSGPRPAPASLQPWDARAPRALCPDPSHVGTVPRHLPASPEPCTWAASCTPGTAPRSCVHPGFTLQG